jgi:predicted PurR-regulated permease PerM
LTLRSALPPDWRVRAPLYVSLLVVLLLGFVIFRHFLLPFTVAGAVALMLAPLQRRLARRLGGRPSVAATLIVILCAAAVLLPVLSYLALIGQQARTLGDWLRTHLEPAAFEKMWREAVALKHPVITGFVANLTGTSPAGLASGVRGWLVGAANDVARLGLAAAAGTASDFVIILMMLFFLLRDGDQLRDVARGVSPLSRGQETELLFHLSQTVKGTIQATVVVPIVQGAAALLGFWLFGVPAPHLWSMLVMFSALVPLVGSALAWVPAGLFLILSGHEAQGWGVLIYGALVIGTLDNVVKVILLKDSAQIHTLLAFLAILGGVYSFGPKGLIAGPVILSLLITAYRIYRFDILRWRQVPAVPAAQG